MAEYDAVVDKYEVISVTPAFGNWDLVVRDLRNNKQKKLTVLVDLTQRLGGGYIFAPGFSYMVWHVPMKAYPTGLIITQCRTFYTPEDCLNAKYNHRTGTWDGALNGLQLEDVVKTPCNTFKYFTDTPPAAGPRRVRR
jgi:hypothetical protein